MPKQATEILRNRLKLAIVWHARLIDGFMENFAQNRAGLMRLFGTDKDGLEWLFDSREQIGPLFKKCGLPTQ